MNSFEAPARVSEKLRTKDQQRLVSLGVNPVDRILRAEEQQKDKLAVFYQESNGHARFKSHLSSDEKRVVKNVAHGTVTCHLSRSLIVL